MKENLNKQKTICTWICGGLLLLLLILQFMPFWSFDGQSISISTYIWFPTEHTDATSYFKSELGESFAVNQIVLMPIIHLVAGVIGVIFCLMRKQNPVVWGLAILCGLAGILGFLLQPAFQLGTVWVLHLLVCIAMLAAGGYAFFLSMGKIKK